MKKDTEKPKDESGKKSTFSCCKCLVEQNKIGANLAHIHARNVQNV